MRFAGWPGWGSLCEVPALFPFPAVRVQRYPVDNWITCVDEKARDAFSRHIPLDH